jgi:chemotaxis signal transduction protein
MGSTSANQYLTFTLADEQYAIGVAKVHEVVEFDEKDIEPAPRFGTRLAAEFIKGVGRRDEAFILLFDIDRIFNTAEVSLLAATVSGEPLTVEAGVAS